MAMLSLARSIRESVVEGKLPCANAFRVAEKEGVSPHTVGREATRLSIRISRCQLGLFGYEDISGGRLVHFVENISDALTQVIRCRLAESRLPCEDAWAIASQQTLSKLDVANAAQTLGIRIAACQLGCFD